MSVLKLASYSAGKIAELEAFLIKQLQPVMGYLVEEVLKECAHQKLDVVVYETLRSPERDRRLYQKGRVQSLSSYNQLGLGVEFAFLKNEKINWSPSNPWKKLEAICKNYGLTSGRGRFIKSHYELRVPGLSKSTLFRCKDSPHFNFIITERLLRNPGFEKLIFSPGKIAIGKSESADKKLEPKPKALGIWARIIKWFADGAY